MIYVKNLNQINKMKHLTFFFSITLTFFILSCNGQNISAGEYYKNCMKQRLSGSGIDFYREMQSAENYLIQHHALEGNDRISYVNAFNKLLDDSSYFDFFYKIQKNLPEEFNLGSVAFDLFSLCSDIEVNEIDSNCTCLNIQKSLLKKIYFKQFNDDEILDDLLIFTDFKDDTLRMHITYLFLLNMKAKIEK